MSKKANGEGTIYYSESRKRWIGQITLGIDSKGKTKRKSIYGKTKKDVREKMLKMQSELILGEFIEPSHITIERFIKTLIDEDKALNIINDNTYTRKKETYNKIKKSSIADVRIQDATETQIKSFLYSLTDYSDSLIQKEYQLLKRCFAEAQNQSLISKNIMLNIRCPKSKKAKEKVRALTLSEQKNLFEVLKNPQIPYREQMLLMLYTGMRMGEINALDLNDVDLNFKVISVRRSLTKNDEDKTVIGKTTKTYAGQRKIPLSASAATLLTEYIYSNRYQENKYNLLFWDGKANKILTTSQINCQFKRLLKKYDILDNSVPGKVSLHSLRHTSATRCIESGMLPKVLQVLLGHTDIKITLNTYCDAFGEFQMINIKKVEEYLATQNLIS